MVAVAAVAPMVAVVTVVVTPVMVVVMPVVVVAPAVVARTVVVPLGGGRAGQEDEGGGDEAGETKLHGIPFRNAMGPSSPPRLEPVLTSPCSTCTGCNPDVSRAYQLASTVLPKVFSMKARVSGVW